MPIAIFSSPVVFVVSARYPTDTLLFPVVFAASAEYPIGTLKYSFPEF